MNIYPEIDLIWKGGSVETCISSGLSSNPQEPRLLAFKGSPQHNLDTFHLQQLLLSEEDRSVKRIIFSGLRSFVAHELTIEQLQQSIQEWLRSLLSSQ